MEQELIIPREGEGLIELAKRCEALYICPTDSHGNRKGPLVVYAGKGSNGKNLVGDIYFNFRAIEAQPKVLLRFAEVLAEELESQQLLDTFDTLCGIPQGGQAFAEPLAKLLGKRFTHATKVPKATAAGLKQEFDWIIEGFTFDPDERVAVVEDVFNNFQNTDHTLSCIASHGPTVTALLGALNRSPRWDGHYTPESGCYKWQTLPVVSAVREAYPEYEQDDPKVVDDIEMGNLELNVKLNWQRLLWLME